MIEFEQIIPHLEKGARSAYENDDVHGLLDPGFVVGYKGNSEYIVPLKFTDDKEKKALITIIRALFLCHEIDMYGVICKSWVVASPTPLIEVRPQFHKDRKDVLVIGAVAYYVNKVKMILEQDGKLGEELNGDESDFFGDFFQFLPPRGVKIPDDVKAVLLAHISQHTIMQTRKKN